LSSKRERSWGGAEKLGEKKEARRVKGKESHRKTSGQGRQLYSRGRKNKKEGKSIKGEAQGLHNLKEEGETLRQAQVLHFARKKLS